MIGYVPMGSPRRSCTTTEKAVCIKKSFRKYLKENDIKDKAIPAAYPQLQGKVEAYNKIVKNEFLAVENISDIQDGKARYAQFVNAYNMDREHGGIGGLTPHRRGGHNCNC